MLLRLIAAGTRLPGWVQAGYADYAGRLRGDYRLDLVEIPLGQRTGSDTAKAVAKEGERMLGHLADKPYVVALQVGGKALSTEQLAAFLAKRAEDGRPVAFLVGGPEGLAPEVDARADLRWSLSALTLPHALARILVAEALYRAVSVLKNHPYHRA
jgi:23S rRNA (pseudouridine1915-N3)-methyltransferase